MKNRLWQAKSPLYENSLEQRELAVAANDEEKSRLMQIIEDNKAIASNLSEKIFELQDEKQAMAGQGRCKR